VIALALLAFGLQAARKLSVDAFPDVTNVQVQIATEAPGRSPEEVERFVTVPLEIAMTGLPGLTELRSLNKPGLSLITLVFTDATNVYFARQLVMERLLEVGANLPQGVTPVAGRCPRRSARSPVHARAARRRQARARRRTSCSSGARCRTGWCSRSPLDPGRRRDQLHRRLRQAVPGPRRPEPPALLQGLDRRRTRRCARNNANSGGGSCRRAPESFSCAASPDPRPRRHPLDRAEGDRRDAGLHPRRRRGHDRREVRAGAMIKDELHRGRRRDRADDPRRQREGWGRVKARVKEINDRSMLPGGLKIVPYYDRSELVDEALWTVTKVLLEGVFLVVVVLFLFLGDVRSSIIVVATSS
jgi:cobalt-zinc-cadmium resistance protein CzcA